jgi:hypothetical protein
LSFAQFPVLLSHNDPVPTSVQCLTSDLELIFR